MPHLKSELNKEAENRASCSSNEINAATSSITSENEHSQKHSHKCKSHGCSSSYKQHKFQYSKDYNPEYKNKLRPKIKHTLRSRKAMFNPDQRTYSLKRSIKENMAFQFHGFMRSFMGDDFMSSKIIKRLQHKYLSDYKQNRFHYDECKEYIEECKNIIEGKHQCIKSPFVNQRDSMYILSEIVQSIEEIYQKTKVDGNIIDKIMQSGYVNERSGYDCSMVASGGKICLMQVKQILAEMKGEIAAGHDNSITIAYKKISKLLKEFNNISISCH